MRALRKGQASAFNLTRDIRGEARIVERAFGLGAPILAEAVPASPSAVPLHWRNDYEPNPRSITRRCGA